jgi:hypothetical protein
MEVERASESDGKHTSWSMASSRRRRWEPKSLYIALRIALRLNALYDPQVRVRSVVEAMVYASQASGRGRKRTLRSFAKLPHAGRSCPEGGICVVAAIWQWKCFRQETSAFEIGGKLDEYLDAGVPLVWMVTPEPSTIRAYRNDGTTRLFRADDMSRRRTLCPDFGLSVSRCVPGVDHRT